MNKATKKEAHELIREMRETLRYLERNVTNATGEAQQVGHIEEVTLELIGTASQFSDAIHAIAGCAGEDCYRWYCHG